MPGFEAEFEAQGLQRFVETAPGWQLPKLPDRSSPKYVRSAALTDGHAVRFDACSQP